MAIDGKFEDLEIHFEIRNGELKYNDCNLEFQRLSNAEIDSLSLRPLSIRFGKMKGIYQKVSEVVEVTPKRSMLHLKYRIQR